jgi:protocatechuate 3,4-dioxygenase beta subunit
VDVWHCDAQGGYSSFDGRGGSGSRTYLRGSQRTDAKGRALFRTIWPGWYQGRAPHVHFKVLLQNNEVLTAQLYFPDAINARVYSDAVYGRRWAEAASNARDGIFRGAGGAGVARISEEKGMMVAALDVGIGRRA